MKRMVKFQSQRLVANHFWIEAMDLTLIIAKTLTSCSILWCFVTKKRLQTTKKSMASNAIITWSANNIEKHYKYLRLHLKFRFIKSNRFVHR